MTVQSPILTWLVLGLCLFGPLALLGIAMGVSRLVEIKSGFVTLAIFGGACLLTGFAVFTYLDNAGETVVGEVLDKKEVMLYHLDGSWNQQMEAVVTYRLTDVTPAITDTLKLLQDRFDEMHQGDFVPLRCFNLAGLLHLTRLEDQKTSSQLWARAEDQPFFLFLALGFLLVVAARLIRQTSFRMLFCLIGLVTIGAWWVTGVAQPMWEQASVRMGSMNTVNGNVRETHRPYLGNDLRAWISGKLFSPYEVVLVDMTPLGHSQKLMAIDVVDLGSVSVKAGQNISLEYSPGNPRFAVIPDATRNYLWKNALASTVLALMALFVVIAVTLLLRSDGEGSFSFLREKKRRRPRNVPA